MFCSNCGKQIENGIKFCPNCGKPVKAVNANIIQPMQQQIQAQTTPVQVQTPNTPQLQVQYLQNPYINQNNGICGYQANPDLTVKDKYFSWHGRLNRKPYILRSI